MLVNSFDTKFGKTAIKYENLDNTFVNLLKKKKIYNRIFTSVLIDKKIINNINLRSDITGQVLNSVISQNLSSKQNLYYLGDVFKKDLASSQIKQFREHGVEILNQLDSKSFSLITNLLVEYLNLIIKKKYSFIFTDPAATNSSKFILEKKISKNKIPKLVKDFSLKNKKIPFVVNSEKNFFSKEYHREIFFYVYSDVSKKILAQGGGYKYKKNNKVLNGFGFSCNIDNWVELI
ncbi:ATP phosphoribosyltransferase regulatory subunit [Alphaproteobacteria bacterium]|nr:ATP phosphoribosyltransferase regulatory subunit [Alphaproteobacteria bacterium]